VSSLLTISVNQPLILSMIVVACQRHLTPTIDEIIGTPDPS